jgi:hypothetical protein
LKNLSFLEFERGNAILPYHKHFQNISSERLHSASFDEVHEWSREE